MKKIEYVSLTDTLFLGGKNHGMKIMNGPGGVEIEHDKETDHVKIHYKGQTATIKHYGAIIESEAKEVKQAVQAPRGKITAQVSSPTDHVFAGEPGKVRN